MDYRILLCFMFLHSLSNAFPHGEESYEDNDDFDTASDETEEYLLADDQKEKPIDLTKKIITDKPPPAKYEVTEIVIDIPDDRTRGPIITNFTISKPLNVASTPLPTLENKDKNTANNNNNPDKEIDENPANNKPNKEIDGTDEDNGKGKKNCISILHVKAEFDDKTNSDRIQSSDIDFGNVPHVSGIKEYFNGIKQGIVNGFNSIIHKHKKTEDNHSHDSETGPFSFFNKIQKKSSNFAQKIHNHIFGDQEEDDEEFHHF